MNPSMANPPPAREIDQALVQPLLQALAKQREAASNAAAECEARNFVLAVENATLKKRIEELSAPHASEPVNLAA